MIKDKDKEDKIVEAHPSVSLLSGINIKGQGDIDIRIGGFTMDGGLVLESPYELVKEETKIIFGDVTYYSVIKNSTKMSEREEKLREVYGKRQKEEKEWKEKRKKEIKEELKRIEEEEEKGEYNKDGNE